MLWNYLPCGTYQHNSCYNSTLENRWQFCNQEEQVNIDCSNSDTWLTSAERCYMLYF